MEKREIQNVAFTEVMPYDEFGHNTPDRIAIRREYDWFYEIREDEAVVEHRGGRFVPHRVRRILGRGFYPHFFTEHYYLIIVDTRPVEKHVHMDVLSSDHFPFHVCTSVVYHADDTVYIARNADRFEGLIERTIRKPVNRIVSGITLEKGWEGNALRNVTDVENELKANFPKYGVEYDDILLRLFCPDDFRRMAAHLFFISGLTEAERKKLALYLEGERAITEMETDAVSSRMDAAGRQPNVHIYGTVDFLGTPRPLDSEERRAKRQHIIEQAARRLREEIRKDSLDPEALNLAIRSGRVGFYPWEDFHYYHGYRNPLGQQRRSATGRKHRQKDD